MFTLFLWQGHKGFGLWDEGYLWYGAQRVMLGEVPIRDFMSYDPGRYYWSAALMSLWNDNGIMALRSAVAIFQAIGLFAGLLLIARSSKNQSFVYLLLSALTLAVWMFPRHKLFDISLSILLIGVMVFLIQKPTGRRYFSGRHLCRCGGGFWSQSWYVWRCRQPWGHGMVKHQAKRWAWIHRRICAMGLRSKYWFHACAHHGFNDAGFRHGFLGQYSLLV